jgi:hypothetical protein
MDDGLAVQSVVHEADDATTLMKGREGWLEV